jgi:hypothetical protein
MGFPFFREALAKSRYQAMVSVFPSNGRAVRLGEISIRNIKFARFKLFQDPIREPFKI